MEGAINWFSRNHVAANFLMAAVIVLGIITWPTLKKEIFPETAVDALTVAVPFPNATPEEVERGVIQPIEEAIKDLNGIDTIQSVASQNAGSITVFADVGYDIRDLIADVDSRINTISNLDEGAEEPSIEQLILLNQVLSLALSADTDEASLRQLAERIETGIETYEGGSTRVTRVEIGIEQKYEISIEIPEETLREYGLNFDQVANAIRSSSIDIPGGSIKSSDQNISIRTENRRYDAEGFADITIAQRADGSLIKLGQIAKIRDGFEEGDIESLFNGKPAVVINVLRVGNQDTLKIADTVRKWVAEESPRFLPEGASLTIWRDDSTFLQGRLDLLVTNCLWGLLLVALVLSLFLRPSLALLVALGIPVSFCGAVFLMPILGVSINLISLFAFILVLGIVVDDAIVVGENVYSRMRNGEDPKLASPRGTHEVGVIVIFGVLTTAIAFTPMLGLSGVSGKIWPNIPLIVIPVLLFSLIQSKLILPAHLALLKPYDPSKQKGAILRFQAFFARGMEKCVEKFYRPVLKFALNFRWAVFTGFVALFAITISYVINGHIKFIFIPEVEGEVMSVRLEMAEGVPFETTQRAITKIAKAAHQLGETYKDNDGNSVINNLLATSGTQPFLIGFEGLNGTPTDSHIGEVTVELAAAGNRKHDTEELISEWRRLTGPIPGAVELAFRTETATGGNAIDLEITGPDLEEIRSATEGIKKGLSEIEGVIDINDSDKEGKRELKISLLPSAESLQLTTAMVANQVRQGFRGEEVQRLQRGKDEVIVYVRYPANERKSMNDLNSIRIRTPMGIEVPFSQVATTEFGRSPSQIERRDGQRAITVTADVDKAQGANAGEVVRNLKSGSESYMQVWILNFKNLIRSFFGIDPVVIEDGAIKKVLDSHPGVKIKFQGEQKDQNESLEEMGGRFLLALVAMYILMAIPLKSYSQPLIIMSVIPFGIIGSIIGHIVMGYDLSIMSMCGTIALAGVVVNDSLVLVDYVNRQRRAGKDVLISAWEAGAARFRPILLTSMTTFAGLTPMLLATDLQAKFLIPMAISLSFGIIFATALTLILVPCIYLMIYDLKAVIKRAIS